MVNVKRALLTVATFVSFLVICVGTGTDYWATADKVSGIKADSYFGLYNIHLVFITGISPAVTTASGDYTITPDCKIEDEDGGVSNVDSQCNNVRGMQGFAILSVLTSFAGFLASIAFAATNPKGSATAAGVLLVLAAFFGMLCMAIFIEARQNNRGPLFVLDQYNWTYGYSAGIFIFGWLLALVCAVFTFLSNKSTDD